MAQLVVSKILELYAIPGHPAYAVTKSGEVWSRFHRGGQHTGIPDDHRWTRLAQHMNKATGYLKVSLRVDQGKYPTFPVHRIMAYVFLGLPLTGTGHDAEVVCHLDHDTTNNNWDNLAIVSQKDNIKQSQEAGRMSTRTQFQKVL